MNKLNFTEEQLNWLKEILTPKCCHVSGEHNPTHFEENPEKFCYIQKYNAYDRICKELGFDNIVVRPDPDCYWCRNLVGKIWNKETKKWE